MSYGPTEVLQERAREIGAAHWLMQRRHVCFKLKSLLFPTHRVQCVKLNPKWGKGWARKGAALHGARNYDEAITAYNAGLALEDSPALKKGLQEVQDARGTINNNHPAKFTHQLYSKPLIKGPLVSGKYSQTPISSVNWRPIHELRNISLILPSCKRYASSITATHTGFSRPL